MFLIVLFGDTDFNPRSHEESDESLAKIAPDGSLISIHALTKRATKLVENAIRINRISIHALTKRATQLHRIGLVGRGNFNPRSHEESDMQWSSYKGPG